MDFGRAIESMKKGSSVARKGWNGKGMFIYLVAGQQVPIENLRNESAKAFKSTSDRNRGKLVTINSHIDMKAADGSIVVGWLASQTDMLADDWELVN